MALVDTDDFLESDPVAHDLRERCPSALKRVLPLLALAAVTLAGAAIRVHELGNSSLWFDEAAIWQISRGPLQDVLDQNNRINSAPPLYPLLVKLVAEFLGNSEALLRSVSVAGGVLSLVGLAALSRQWLGWTGTVVAVSIAASAPVQVHYSRELREYADGVFLTTVLLLCIHRLVRAPTSRWSMPLYTITGAVCIAMQFGLWIVVFVTHCAYFIATARSRSRSQLASFAASSACFGAATFAVYWVSLSGRIATGDLSFSYLSYYYLTNRTAVGLLHEFVEHSRTFAAFMLYGGRGPLAISISGTLLAFGAVAFLRRKGHYRLALVYAIAPVALVTVLSMLSYYPYGGVRQDMFLSPMLYILLAAGVEYLTKLRQMVLGRPVGAYLAILVAVGLPLVAILGFTGHLADLSEYVPLHDENLRTVLTEMADRVQPGDRIYVFPIAGPGFHYYWEGRRIGAKLPETEIVLRDDLIPDPARDLSEVSALLSTGDRVWVVSTLAEERATITYLESQHAELDRITTGGGDRRYGSFIDSAAFLFSDHQQP